MSYIAPDPGAFLGAVVPDGQCVAYVKKCAGCPATSQWAEGKKVKGVKVAKGTAIATFQNGNYNNYTDGRSHAAIFLEEVAEGLRVYDQWAGRPVTERVIRFKGGTGEPRNDGDAYSIIESRAVLAATKKAHERQISDSTESKARVRLPQD